MSLPIPVLGLLCLIRILELIQVIIFPTINRLTTPQLFLVYLAGSFLADDVIIALIAIVSSLVLFHRKNVLFILVPALIAAAIGVSVWLQNQLVADVVALASFPLVIFAYVFSRYQKIPFNLKISRNSLLTATTALFLAIEVAALLTWIFYPIFPTTIYSGWNWYGADIQSKLFYAAGLLSPGLMAILIFSFALRPAVYSSVRWKKLLERFTNEFQNVNQSKKTAYALLVVACFISIGLGVYVYLPSINNNFQNVSVDAPFYINQLDLIKSHGIFAKGGPFDRNIDRAFSLLIFYGITAALNQPAQYVVAFLPIPLTVSLVITTFVLVRYGLRNNLAAGFAAILTAFSVQFVVGVYAGFFSNLMALSFAMVALFLFLKYQNNEKRYLSFSLFILVMVLLLITHVYTWVFLASAIVLSTLIMSLARKNANRRSELRQNIPIYLGICSMVGIVLVIASVSSISGVTHLTNLASSDVNPNFFATRWFTTNYTFRIYLGGFLTNSLLIAIAIFWALKVDYGNRFNVLILSGIYITSIFFFVGDTVVQSRMFYNVPLQIPAAIILAEIASFRSSSSGLWRNVAILIVILGVAHLANYGIRSVANTILR